MNRRQNIPDRCKTGLVLGGKQLCQQQGVAPEVVLAHVPPTSVDVGATDSIAAGHKSIVQRERSGACEQAGRNEVLGHVPPPLVIGSLATNLAGEHVVAWC